MTPDLPIPEDLVTDELVKLADRAYWDKFNEAGVFELQDGDLEAEVAMRAALEAVLPHLRSLQVETQVEYGRALGRKEAAEEIAAKCLRRAQLAERVPEPMRSGVREGMVVTWLAAQKLAWEVAEPTSEPRTDPPAHPSHPQDSQTAREEL